MPGLNEQGASARESKQRAGSYEHFHSAPVADAHGSKWLAHLLPDTTSANIARRTTRSLELDSGRQALQNSSSRSRSHTAAVPVTGAVKTRQQSLGRLARAQSTRALGERRLRRRGHARRLVCRWLRHVGRRRHGRVALPRAQSRAHWQCFGWSTGTSRHHHQRAAREVRR